MQEIKHVLTEKHDFGNRDESLLIALLGDSGLSGFSCKVQKFLCIEWSSNTLEVSVEISMIEIKAVVKEKYAFECRDVIKLFALFRIFELSQI